MSTSSISLATNVLKLLDSKTQPDEIVKPSDVADDTKLARFITGALSAIAALQRRFSPDAVIFRDIATTGTNASPITITLTHRLGGTVDWWIVRCRSLNTSTSPILVETASDGTVLTLLCYGTATFDIRVQESG